jgi:hypothetical protein
MVLAVITSMFFACNSPDSAQGNSTEEAAADSTAQETEETSEVASPNTALIISHGVADFDAWKAKYDEHASARAEANLSDWALLTGRDNPNMVTIIFKVGDMEAAKAFIASEDLKSKMAEAGVEGEPSLQFASVEVMDQEAAKSSDVRLYVKHKVENYEAWKAVFDSKADMHKEAGVTPVAIGRNLEDPNDLTVVLTAADFESLEAFIENAELKEAMEKAGVIGKPVFDFMNLQKIQF